MRSNPVQSSVYICIVLLLSSPNSQSGDTMEQCDKTNAPQSRSPSASLISICLSVSSFRLELSDNGLKS